MNNRWRLNLIAPPPGYNNSGIVPVEDRVMHASDIQAWSIPEPNSGCWLWLRAASRGYGAVRVGGKVMAAHRLSYALHKGDIPAGLFVLHNCDNPLCVNPDHLRVGTVKDNADDMVKRGRMNGGRGTAGELNGNRRFTLDQINEIREAHRSTGNYARLARQYGVARSTIRRICIGDRWKYAALISNELAPDLV